MSSRSFILFIMKRFYCLLSIVISLAACNIKTDRPFFTSDEYWEKVQQQFGERKQLA
jgi:hypothetical protein